jgi:hypothetical protein
MVIEEYRAQQKKKKKKKKTRLANKQSSEYMFVVGNFVRFQHNR